MNKKQCQCGMMEDDIEFVDDLCLGCYEEAKNAYESEVE